MMADSMAVLKVAMKVLWMAENLVVMMVLETAVEKAVSLELCWVDSRVVSSVN